MADAAADPPAGARPIVNPADRRDIVGCIVDADPAEVAEVCARRRAPGRNGAGAPRASARAFSAGPRRCSRRTRRVSPCSSVGKPARRCPTRSATCARQSISCAITARRSHDFDNATHHPLGIVACISPWNFPIAIFTGQLAAALAAGNAVVAKPAEETPLIAVEAVQLMHEAGVPADALRLLPGDGAVGAALTANPHVAGVMFTGSTEVARLIAASLAQRLGPDDAPIPLIAETGGQNALIVDSSALAEQVVGDVLSSAFDSAGQRCSALRVLCLQDDIAERTLKMLKSAMRELQVGPPDRLSCDVGPVISAEALAGLERHVEEMRVKGLAVHAEPLGEDCAHGFSSPQR